MKAYQDINKEQLTDGLRKAGNGGSQFHMNGYNQSQKRKMEMFFLLQLSRFLMNGLRIYKVRNLA